MLFIVTMEKLLLEAIDYVRNNCDETTVDDTFRIPHTKKLIDEISKLNSGNNELQP